MNIFNRVKAVVAAEIVKQGSNFRQFSWFGRNHKPPVTDKSMELIEELVSDEGATVTISGPNPDFNGLPDYVIVYAGPATEWSEFVFRGNTQEQCLQKALAFKRQSSQLHRIRRNNLMSNGTWRTDSEQGKPEIDDRLYSPSNGFLHDDGTRPGRTIPGTYKGGRRIV